VVVFAGPVIVKPAFDAIAWGRPTRIVPVVGAGSSYFQQLAASLRRDGRILPSLLERYVGMPRSEIGRLVLCSYSAGWGLLNEIFQVDADRADVNACVLSDSAFGGPLRGHEAFAADAIWGRKLMVLTNSNNAANAALGIMKTARETVTELLDDARDQSGALLGFHRVQVRAPLTVPSGGAWRLGKCFWLDYVQPGAADNTGNDYTHGEHHDLAAAVWQAYLVPYLSGWPIVFPWGYVLGGAAAVGGGYWGYRKLRH